MTEDNSNINSEPVKTGEILYKYANKSSKFEEEIGLKPGEADEIVNSMEKIGIPRSATKEAIVNRTKINTTNNKIVDPPTEPPPNGRVIPQDVS